MSPVPSVFNTSVTVIIGLKTQLELGTRVVSARAISRPYPTITESHSLISQGAKLHMSKPKSSSKCGLGELNKVPWGCKI